MSKWTKLEANNTREICFCAGCGQALLFPEGLEPPELLKHEECGAEWVLLNRGKTLIKDQGKKVNG